MLLLPRDSRFAERDAVRAFSFSPFADNMSVTSKTNSRITMIVITH